MISARRKWLLGLAIVAGLLAIVGALAHLRARWAVNRWKAGLMAQGEKLEIRDAEPPRPDAAENAFAELSRLSVALSRGAGAQRVAPPALRVVAPGRAISFASLTNWVTDYWSKDGKNVTWADLNSQLADCTQVVAEVRQVLRKPILGANLDYSQGFNIPLPHLAKFKSVSQTLQVVAMSDLHAGRFVDAAANVEAMLCIVQGTEHEALFISQLVRMAVVHIALAATWQVLQVPRVDDAPLAALQRRWEALEFINATRRAIVMERAMQLDSIRIYRQSHAKFVESLDAWAAFIGGTPPAGTNLSDVFAEMPERTVRGLGYFVWRWYWSYTDQLRMLQIEQPVLDALRLTKEGKPFVVTHSNLVVELAPFRTEPGNDDDDTSFLSGASQMRMRTMLSDAALVFERAPSKVMSIETARILVVTAVALKRFQQKRSRMPEALTELVPEFLSLVPVDPMDGRPVRYRVLGDGQFLLYSVGLNGKDEGGHPQPEREGSSNFNWLNGKDWVWPAPASEEEVREFNAREEQKRSRRR